MQHKEITRLITLLHPVAAAAAQPQHWIGGGNNEAMNYCRNCAETEIEKLRAANPDKDYWLDGGWEAHEADGCVHCEKCQALLSYTLTRFGVSAELDHYVRHMKRKGGLPPEEGYHITAILEQLEFSEDLPQVARAIRMGKRAIQLLPAHAT